MMTLKRKVLGWTILLATLLVAGALGVGAFYLDNMIDNNTNIVVKGLRG